MSLLVCNCIVRVTQPEYGCEVNSDCRADQACVNKACVDPCGYEPCSKTAICHVEYHNAVCRCPIGQIGDARVECRYPSRKTSSPPSTNLYNLSCLSVCHIEVSPSRIAPPPTPECTSSSQCAPDRSCVNNRCIDPCNCGPNAQCRVINHFAICTCPAGFSGNPSSGCFQCEHYLFF